MQSVQRQFGKLWTKRPGDNAKVSVILKDYEDADEVLSKLIDSTRSWRDSWVALVTTQSQTIAEFEGLYDPVVGATDGHGRAAEPTPEIQLRRTFQLNKAYRELKTELIEELVGIEERIIRPATSAREFIQPLRKTIKKREAKRLEYEKCQDKVGKLHKKPGKTAKDDIALAKAEEEMTRAADEFGVTDDHLRQMLPPVIAATFSLIPPLLAAHVLIQNRLLGLYYTTLHAYCEGARFPSPAPPMQDVISDWEGSHMPIRQQIESMSFVVAGRVIRPPPSAGNSSSQHRTPSFSNQITREDDSMPRPVRHASQASLHPPSFGPSDQGTPSTPGGVGSRRPSYFAPTDFTTATVLGGTSVRSSPSVSPNPSQARGDYFEQQSSRVNSIPKKKPPPPPPKRMASSFRLDDFVVAQFTFSAQEPGDLGFQEGAKIKVLERSKTDWWVGELNGNRGNFPANYCKPC